MSMHSKPILYLNVDDEMLYVLRQRLKVQKIDVDRTIQYVIGALLNPKISSSMLEESSMTGICSLRSTLEYVAISSIMKLEKISVNKWFNLMIIMVKYQLTVANGPSEVIFLTLNYIDPMHDMFNDVNAEKCVTLVNEMVIDFDGYLTCEKIWNSRRSCLTEFELYNVKVSILLRRDLRDEDIIFNMSCLSTM